MLNIVLPIAGRGSRFSQAGYALPKPLIAVHDTPMIQMVVENVRPRQPHRFVFLALAEHLRDTPLRAVLERAAPGCTIVSVGGVTEGAACTVLLAREVIDRAEPLMLANSDQYLEVDINAYLGQMERDGAAGSMVTFWADQTKWSYARLDGAGHVCEVVEKRVVSNEATVGIYNFRDGRDFVRGADRMIEKNLRVNGEFYVAPVYNELIADGQVITIYPIGEGMHGTGTPEDLETFLAHPASQRYRRPPPSTSRRSTDAPEAGPLTAAEGAIR